MKKLILFVEEIMKPNICSYEFKFCLCTRPLLSHTRYQPCDFDRQRTSQHCISSHAEGLWLLAFSQGLIVACMIPFARDHFLWGENSEQVSLKSVKIPLIKCLVCGRNYLYVCCLIHVVIYLFIIEEQIVNVFPQISQLENERLGHLGGSVD